MILSLVLTALLAAVWLVTWVLPKAIAPAMTRAVEGAHRQFARSDSWLSRQVPKALIGPLTDGPLIAALAVALILGVWAFFALLEDVVTGDPIIGIDKTVYLSLQHVRHAWVDTVMVGMTELGDSKVVIPVSAAAVLILLALMRWRAAAFVLIATAGASAFVGGLKEVIHRPRPVSIYDGLAHYSFPSGHASMSVVLYGFLAFLLAYGAPASWRRGIAFAALSLIALIAFSRVYLGAHWLSDVLAGLAFGVAWVAGLAIVYLRASPRPMPFALFASCLMVALVAAGSWHMVHDLSAETKRYAVPADIKAGKAP